MQINFLNIPQIYSKKTFSVPNSTSIKPRQPLAIDTVSFNGNKDLLELSDEEILDRIKTSMSNLKNYLGQGSEAKVYKIENSNYCARLAHLDSINSVTSPLKRNITKMDKVNHIVAKFGKYSSIMHYIEGSPVLSDETLHTSKGLQMAEEITKIPVISFNKFLKQICEAYDKGMMFDCSWANVIINPKNQTITAIDFYKNEEHESLKPLSFMFASLVNSDTTTNQCKIYANKILNAAIDEFSPGTKPCWNISQFDFSSILKRVNHKVKLDDNYQELLTKSLNKLQELKYRDIRGIDVTKELEYNIKIIRTLIKQIL